MFYFWKILYFMSMYWDGFFELSPNNKLGEWAKVLQLKEQTNPSPFLETCVLKKMVLLYFEWKECFKTLKVLYEIYYSIYLILFVLHVGWEKVNKRLLSDKRAVYICTVWHY